ncbi:MAG: hypothetical protein CMM52_06760 [Rhodospirillaceae bacterium]|nr:hypothetical protein [Rhodospirillaceae bacterium]|tara:strand:+ start:12594 stop:13811 length:1218 start_codon:yes stop_codon:yes gene_type:complete
MNETLARDRLIFPILASITFVSPMANHMFIPALSHVKQEFGVGDDLAFMTLSFAIISMAITSVLYGGLSDQWGRKRVLLGGLALYTIGAELVWFAPTIELVIAGRILQGAGAGCGIVLARAIARDVYGMGRISSVIANLTAAYVLGPLLSPTIGAYFIAWQGWRFLFIFITAVGLTLIAIVYFRLPETNPQSGRHVPFSSIVKGTLRNYGQLLRVPRFTAYALLPGFLSGVFFANAAASSVLAQETLNMPTEIFGLWFLLMPVAFMIGNLISGQIGNRMSIGFMTIAGSSLSLLVVVLQWFWHATMGLSILVMIIPGAIQGIAQGMCMPYAQTGALRVNPSLAGAAAGAVVFAQLFFAGMAELAVGLRLDGTLIPVTYVMFVFAIAGVLTAIFAEISLRRSVGRH